jgi:hypothetical protein
MAVCRCACVFVLNKKIIELISCVKHILVKWVNNFVSYLLIDNIFQKVILGIQT